MKNFPSGPAPALSWTSASWTITTARWPTPTLGSASCKTLEARGLPSGSLIVFVADHGESLGEHSYTGHGRNLYQPGLHVPFALIGPGIPQDQRLDFPVELLDLAPTVLAGLHLPAGEKML